MNPKLEKTVYWAPRILTILFAIFVSLFALDVFGEGYGFWESILAFIIHLVPTYLVIIALLIAWKWELAGAIMFFGLGTWYMTMVWGRGHWTWFLFISGPTFLVGALYLWGWFIKKKANKRTKKKSTKKRKK